jgi:hypothetical protein
VSIYRHVPSYFMVTLASFNTLKIKWYNDFNKRQQFQTAEHGSSGIMILIKDSNFKQQSMAARLIYKVSVL